MRTVALAAAGVCMSERVREKGELKSPTLTHSLAMCT